MPAYALNFYSPIVEQQLRSQRKTATIRLGDKSRKYQKGMIVSVLVGARFGTRQHVFDAVIDKVEVKRLDELSPREIEHDNPEIRRAMALAVDRQAFVRILAAGEGDLGGAMLPPPEGVWGSSEADLKGVAGYGDDIARNRDEARAIMRAQGFGPDKRLPFKLAVRNLAVYRDPGTIMIDQLREIFLDGELETTETATWVPKLIKKDYKVSVNVLGNPVDDPDVVFYQNYVCDSPQIGRAHV